MQMIVLEEIYNKLDHAKKIASLEPKKSIEISREVYELAINNDLYLGN